MSDDRATGTRQPRLSVRIMLGVGTLVAVVLLVIGALTYLSVDDEIEEVYDSQLVNSASVLWSLTRTGDAHALIQMDDKSLPLSREDRKTLHKYSKWRSFRVWHGGQLVRSSEAVPRPGLPPLRPGLTDIEANGETWRVYTLHVAADDMTIEVGEKLRARYALIGRVIRDLYVPLLFGVPFILVAIWLGTRWGLRDLRRLAHVVSMRSSTDLSEIDISTTPAEIAPLARSLNTLFGELGRSLDQERRFTDNAAHELRTPIATLGVQANVIMNARTAKERKDAGAQLAKGVSRASRLLDQLLTLARIRHAPLENSHFSLYDHTRDAIRDIYTRAVDKDITLSLSGDEGAKLNSKPAALAILLNNVLDNAIKYSPPGGAVEVYVDAYTITVQDEGPGISPDELDLVFTRFYRARGVNETGSGLGLSIVKNIAEILPASVQLENRKDRSGLLVSISFA